MCTSDECTSARAVPTFPTFPSFPTLTPQYPLQSPKHASHSCRLNSNTRSRQEYGISGCDPALAAEKQCQPAAPRGRTSVSLASAIGRLDLAASCQTGRRTPPCDVSAVEDTAELGLAAPHSPAVSAQCGIPRLDECWALRHRYARSFLSWLVSNTSSTPSKLLPNRRTISDKIVAVLPYALPLAKPKFRVPAPLQGSSRLAGLCVPDCTQVKHRAY